MFKMHQLGKRDARGPDRFGSEGFAHKHEFLSGVYHVREIGGVDDLVGSLVILVTEITHLPGQCQGSSLRKPRKNSGFSVGPVADEKPLEGRSHKKRPREKPSQGLVQIFPQLTAVHGVQALGLLDQDVHETVCQVTHQRCQRDGGRRVELSWRWSYS